MANSTAKYAQNGELFALMHLGSTVSEDTSSGRLILNNCVSVFVASKKPKGMYITIARATRSLLVRNYIQTGTGAKAWYYRRDLVVRAVPTLV